MFKDTGDIVVAHYAGLTVADMTTLRARMRDAGAGVKVAKNRLAKLALKGTDAEAIMRPVQGSDRDRYSKDPVAAPKVATDFAKTNEKLVILGGAMGRPPSTQTASRRSPRCRRSTNSGPGWSA